MANALESVTAWVLALAIMVGLILVLVLAVRAILRETAGKPWSRAFWLFGFTIGLFAWWAASRVVP